MQKIILDGQNLREDFDARLKPYAQKNSASRGRKHPETPDPHRLPFQRDRDRIIHSTAFRRLQGKTQVVSPSKGDHFRNRLSHTIEVSQIARDLARQLGLNEDLAEAIALAHDLGHPPFGHAGERALDESMRQFEKGFDHNKQSLRVVEKFEARYPHFPGINLTHEVLEGIQKHESVFYQEGISVYRPHLEQGLVDLADEIAYLAADIEDGLRGEFFQLKELRSLGLGDKVFTSLEKETSALNAASFNRRLIRLLLSQLVVDTEKNIKDFGIKTRQDVQQEKRLILGFNATFYASFFELKKFLFQHYYSSDSVKKVTEDGQMKIKAVFAHLIENPKDIPSDFFPGTDTPRRACDYIAGMTDAFLEGRAQVWLK